MKKWISLLCLISLITLAACGNGGAKNGAASNSPSASAPDGGTASVNSPEQSSNEASAGGDKAKVSFWHIETGTRQQILNDTVAKFMEDHPNVEIEVVQIPNDQYKQKLTVAMGGGTPPDIFHSWGGGWLKQFVTEGQVLELTEKIDENNYLPSGVSVAKFDGKLYGVPQLMSIVPVYYNKEIFEKFNLSPPQTYDELLSIVDTLNNNNVTPFAMANKTKWPAAFFLMYFAERFAGPEIFNEAFQRTGRTFDDEGYIKAGEMIQQLVNRKAFNLGFNGLDYDTGQSRQLLYTGRAAMEVQTSGYLNNVRSEAPDFIDKLGMFSFPAIDGGKGSINNLVGGVSPTFSVSSKTKQADIATKLIQTLTSAEVGQRIVDETSAVAAMKGVNYNDPLAQQLNGLLEKAEFMQTFYDQTLPPELAELHKDTTQELFGLTMTPQEAAEAMEAKAKETLK